MADIVITDLSNSVLEILRKRGLAEHSIREFERYGIRPILAEFRGNGNVVYSEETVRALVWREWEKVKEALLPRYQWAYLRRAGVYFEQMANSGKIQELHLPKWEAENNPLFLSADPNPEKANDIETVVCLTRDQVQRLDLGSKAKINYIYCGFGAILKYFEARGESEFSQETLDACIAEGFGKWKNGEMSLTMWQNIRKTALWIKEYRNTGMITHRRLSNAEFAYTNPEYEQLLQEYREYMESESCLKEKSRNEYYWAVRRFFRNLEELGRYEYQKLGLADITECISKIARETRCAIFGTLQAMRSFARFMVERHPELPDITPALNCVPAKHRRVYEGYTDEEAQKILNSIDRESVQGKRDYAMLMIANDTGLRGIDILSLKFSSIDWDKRELRIVQEKTGKPLALPFDTLTGNAIADYILNARPECDSEYIFIRLCRPYTRLRSMWTIVAQYAQNALGKTDKMNGPHAFRRGMGRRLIEAGVPTSTVCDIMGHTSTMSILQYTSASVESLRQCCRTLEEIPVEQEALL